MVILTLYHGTPEKEVNPIWGPGNDKHDYGRGFYLTENKDLAKEWAVCIPKRPDGWVHCYELDTEGLSVLDFQSIGVIPWLAELMKHRTAVNSKRYRMLQRFSIFNRPNPSEMPNFGMTLTGQG